MLHLPRCDTWMLENRHTLAVDGPDNCLGQDLGPYPDAQTTRLHHRHHVGTKRPWMPNGDVVVSFPYRNVEKQISSSPI